MWQWMYQNQQAINSAGSKSYIVSNFRYGASL